MLLLIGILVGVSALVLLGLRSARLLHLWPPALLAVTAPMEVYRTNVGALNLSVFRLALGVAGTALVVDLFRRVPSGWRIPLPFAVYGLLLALQLISLVLVTSAPSLGYRYLSQYAAGLFAATVFVRFVRRGDLKPIVMILLVAAVLPAGAAALRIFLLEGGQVGTLPGLSLLKVDEDIEASRQSASVLLEGTRRLQGTYGDPNHFGLYIATVLIIAVGAVAVELRRSQGNGRDAQTTLYVLAASVAGVLVVGSYSRSAWTLCVVGGVMLLFLLGRNILRQLANTRRIAIGIVVAAFFSLVGAPIVYERLTQADESARQSNRAHEETMRLALDLLVERPVLGTGLGAYGAYAGQPELVSSSHSTPLTTAAELGFPGLLALLGALFTTAYFGALTARRSPDPEERILIAALVSAYVGLATANLFYETWADDFQWVLFGAIMATTAQPVIHLGLGDGLQRIRDRQAS